MWERLHNVSFGNDFMDVTPKAQAMKPKIGKCAASNLQTPA